MNKSQLLKEYEDAYDLKLATPNDRGNLEMMINNQLLISKLQEQLSIETEMNWSVQDDNDKEERDRLVARINAIKKLQDSLRDLIEQNLAIERALGIDRKSRKKDNQESFPEYLAMVKNSAVDWLDQYYIKVSCPHCNILVARVIPVHEYTEFNVKFQCSQCNKFVEVKRKERDIFFDIKERDKEWRKKHPIEIVHPSEKQEDDNVLIEDEYTGDTIKLNA